MEIVFVLLLVTVIVIGQRLVFDKLSFKKFDYSCAFSVTEATQGDFVVVMEHHLVLKKAYLYQHLVELKQREHLVREEEIVYQAEAGDIMVAVKVLG